MECSKKSQEISDTVIEKSESSVSLENPVTKYVLTMDNVVIQLKYERLQLEEQIRKFVQLLTQTYLLSFGISELSFINTSSKKILMDLKQISSEKVFLLAHNLNEALDIVSNFENRKEEIHIRSFKANKGNPCIPRAVKNTIINSKVFMYPDLLPTCGFSRRLGCLRQHFTPAEDSLIAMGLERFSTSTTPFHDIQTNLIPCKTISQLKIRVKNAKCKAAPENPIKYYCKHKSLLPATKNFKPFDENNVKAPKDQPNEDLPDWITRANPQVLPNQVAPKILPKPQTSAVPDALFLSKIAYIPQTNSLIIIPSAIPSIPKKAYKPILPKGGKLNEFDVSQNSSVNNSADSYASDETKKYTVHQKVVTKPLNFGKKRKAKLSTDNSYISKQNDTELLVYNKKNIFQKVTKSLNFDNESFKTKLLDNNSCNSKQNSSAYLVNTKTITSDHIPESCSNTDDFSKSNVRMCNQEQSKSVCKAAHLKKQQVSKTVDYYPDSSGKNFIVIKSEVMSESDESIQDTFLVDPLNSGTSDSAADTVNKDTILDLNFKKRTIENDKTMSNVTEKSSLNECLWKLPIKQEPEDDYELHESSNFMHDKSTDYSGIPYKLRFVNKRIVTKSTKDKIKNVLLEKSHLKKSNKSKLKVKSKNKTKLKREKN